MKIMFPFKDAISDLNYLSSGEKAGSKHSFPPFSAYQEEMRRDSKNTLQWHASTNHSDHAIMKMRLIPEKGTKFNLPESLEQSKNLWLLDLDFIEINHRYN